MKYHVALLVFVFGLAHIGTAIGQPDELPNCPVKPENEAVKEYYVDYDGKRYYLCCEACVEDFQSDPSRFASLESVVGFPLESLDGQSKSQDDVAAQPTPTLSERFLLGIIWVEKFSQEHGLFKPLLVLHWAPLLLLLAWAIRRIIVGRRHQSEQSNTRAGGMPSWAIWGIAVVLLADGVWLALRLQQTQNLAQHEANIAAQLRQEMDRFHDKELEEEVHFATFINYGFPPRPRRAEKANSLSATYYRGNDERIDSMFNGGQYLTVTFHIRLETVDGKPLEYGQNLGDGTLQLRVEFERASSTSSGYFTSEYMKRMYLTMQADRFLGRTRPVSDRVDWIESTPGKVWQATYVLPTGDNIPAQWKTNEPDRDPHDRRLRGVVYLCEERRKLETVAGGRYHYAIEYDVLLNDGIVTEASDLFMGSTYSGRNFTKYQITDEQWLSLSPIPEKP